MARLETPMDYLRSFIKDPAPSRSQWIILFLLVFVTRVLWISAYRSYAVYVKHSVESQDAVFENGNIADNLLAGRGFYISDMSTFENFSGPTAHKPPVYPLFLAILFKLFGNTNFMAIRFAQAAFMSVSILILSRLFGRIFGPSVGLFAGLLMAINPVLAKADVFIENIALAIFFSSLFFTYYWDALLENSGASAKAGFFMGITALTNAAFVPFYPAAFLVLWFHDRKTRWRKGLTMAGVAFLVMLPWTLRNHAVFGMWLPVNSNFPFNVWMGSNPDATGSFTLEGGKTFPIPEDILVATRGMNEAQRNKYFGDIGKRYALAHPKHFLETRAKAFFYFWMTSRPWMGYGERVDILNVGVAALMLLTALAGLFMAAKEQPLAVWVFGLLFMSYASVYALTHADSIDRYRLPLDPYLLGFSAFALQSAARRTLKALRGV